MGASSIKRERHEEGTIFFWIFFAALIFSSLLHLIFFKRAERWVVDGFSAASYDMIVPRTFRMKRVEIDPRTLEETKPPTPAPLKVEKEKPVLPDPRQIPHNVLSKPQELTQEEKPNTFTDQEIIPRICSLELILPVITRISHPLLICRFPHHQSHFPSRM